MLTTCLPGGETNPERAISLRTSGAVTPSIVSVQPSSHVWLNAMNDGAGPAESTVAVRLPGFRVTTLTSAGEGDTEKSAKLSESTNAVFWSGVVAFSTALPQPLL